MSKQLGFDDEFLKALGRVCVNFQALEMDIKFLSWIIISPDTTLGQIATAQLSFSNVRAMAAAMLHYQVKETQPDFRKRLEKLLDEACEIGAERNRLIHSVWFVDNSGSSSRIKWKGTKKGFITEHETVDATRLNGFASRILQASEEFSKLFDDLKKAKIISSKPGLTT